MTQLRSHPRLVCKLHDALRDQLCVAREVAMVVEIMLNPDGRLLIERLVHGVAVAGTMSAAAAEVVIGSVAHAPQTEADDEAPIISGKLPIGGHRSRVCCLRSYQGRHSPSTDAPRASFPHRLCKGEGDDRSPGVGHSQRKRRIDEHRYLRRHGVGQNDTCQCIIAEIVAAAPGDRMVILEDTAEVCPGKLGSTR